MPLILIKEISGSFDEDPAGCGVEHDCMPVGDDSAWHEAAGHGLGIIVPEPVRPHFFTTCLEAAWLGGTARDRRHSGICHE